MWAVLDVGQTEKVFQEPRVRSIPNFSTSVALWCFCFREIRIFDQIVCRYVTEQRSPSRKWVGHTILSDAAKEDHASLTRGILFPPVPYGATSSILPTQTPANIFGFPNARGPECSLRRTVDQQFSLGFVLDFPRHLVTMVHLGDDNYMKSVARLRRLRDNALRHSFVSQVLEDAKRSQK